MYWCLAAFELKKIYNIIKKTKKVTNLFFFIHILSHKLIKQHVLRVYNIKVQIYILNKYKSYVWYKF